MAAADSPKREGGISVLTLAIAAASAVAAAIVVSKFWENGTLWATAMTPVIVTLVKEALERPAQRITDVSGAIPRPRPLAGRGQPEPLVVEEVEPRPGEPPRAAGYRTYAPRAKHWKIALATGVLAFVIAALVLTVPELVAGNSVGGGGRNTTIFGGGSSKESEQEKEPTSTQETAPAETTPQQTTPEEAPAPEEEVPPAETTPEDGGAAPAPEEQQPLEQTTPTTPTPEAEPVVPRRRRRRAASSARGRAATSCRGSWSRACRPSGRASRRRARA